jgi:superfamily II DNA or RNA helicase
MIQLRDYQAEARDAVLSTWGERPWYKGGTDTFQSCVLNIPTSAGKTIVAGAVAEAVAKRGRFLYLADRDELCEQPMDRFSRLLGLFPQLEKASEKASMMAELVVGSVQTLHKDDRLMRFPRDHFRYIFVDEAHRHVEQAKKIREYFDSAKSCGQTATAFRRNLADLSDYYDTVAYELTLFDLVEKGYIVPHKILTLPVEIDIDGVEQSEYFGERDYDRTQLGEAIEPYFEKVAELLVEHCKGRQIVAFLPLIASSQQFAQICRDKGIEARHVDHLSADRKELQRGFHDKEFQLISCSTLLSTGWDCPPCDTLLNLSPTRSAGIFRQKVGRVGRVLPGVIDGIKFATDRREAIAKSDKPYALILDLLFHAERFGLQGPVDLIAADEEEAEEIETALAEADGEVDILEVQSSVREAREAKLARELEEAAKRREEAGYPSRPGCSPAGVIALALHDSKLINYQPLFKWQRLPMTEKQAEILSKSCFVDPATVQDRGHASMLLDTIFRRRNMGLAPYKTVDALNKMGVEGAQHCTDDAAYAYLGGEYPFPFGKFRESGLSLNRVTWGYWQWLRLQPWVEERYPIVWRYMLEKKIVKKEESCELPF